MTSFDTHFIVKPGQRTEHVACFYTVVTHVLLSDWFILFPCFFSPLPILSSASPFSCPHPALNSFPFSGSPTCFLLFVLSFVYVFLLLLFSFSFILLHLRLNLWTSSQSSLSLPYFLLSARSSFSPSTPRTQFSSIIFTIHHLPLFVAISAVVNKTLISWDFKSLQ